MLADEGIKIQGRPHGDGKIGKPLSETRVGPCPFHPLPPHWELVQNLLRRNGLLYLQAESRGKGLERVNLERVNLERVAGFARRDKSLAP